MTSGKTGQRQHREPFSEAVVPFVTNRETCVTAIGSIAAWESIAD